MNSSLHLAMHKVLSIAFTCLQAQITWCIVRITEWLSRNCDEGSTSLLVSSITPPHILVSTECVKKRFSCWLPYIRREHVKYSSTVCSSMETCHYKKYLLQPDLHVAHFVSLLLTWCEYGYHLFLFKFTSFWKELQLAWNCTNGI
jgi:hypothetical protein